MSIIETFEFFETPAPFTHWLFSELRIAGLVGELCCGNGAIVTAARQLAIQPAHRWITNDLYSDWQADYHLDATKPELYKRIADEHGGLDWAVTNPPFGPAIDILEQHLEHVRVGVAMHLRISINEPTKTGKRRGFLERHPPSGLMFLPRYAYQRSKKTGEWSTDNVCAAWLVWLKQETRQFIRYAPSAVIDAAVKDTPAYRAQMDRLMARMRVAVPQ